MGVLVCALVASGCDKPDEVYESLPDDHDPEIANGFASVSHYYTGSKGFEDETLDYDPGIATVEVCSDREIADKQKEMVNQPIIPMVGAGGLDMRGEDWSGLTIDEAQSPDMLCQALYYGDGIAAWGDYYELIAFWDTQTREINDLLVRSGYKGVVTADGSAGAEDEGEFVFEVNEAVEVDGTPLNRGDGGSRDPRTDDNMRRMDRALIETFRPELNADAIDCVDAGSCYIILSGTLPVLVFMSVGLYVVLEPIQQHIVQIEVSLKRPFTIGMGRAEVSGVTPTIYGTAGAGIPDCEVTFGTDWSHIQDECLGSDSMDMAQVNSTYGYEYIVAQMGGTLLYFERSGLAVDEILPLEPTLQAGDKVKILSINAAYEGEFSMPYSDILSIYKTNLDAAIRAEVPSLDVADPSGVEKLRLPGDPDLPAEVQSRYPDRLRPGGVYAAFCDDDGPDMDTEYDRCEETAGRPVLPLVRTLKTHVSSALGADITPRLTGSTFYVQEFEKAVGEYFNGGTPLDDDQINFSPNTSRPDTIYATMSITGMEDRYTLGLYYGGNDDRIHFVNWEKGATRMEEVLYQDAALPTPGYPANDTFTFAHLMDSPRLGISDTHPAIGTVSVDHVVPESRRAVMNITMSDVGPPVQVLAPYLPASSITGYWIPLEGPHSIFQPADFFQLYGGTIGAAFYLLPESLDSDELEVVAVTGSGFFGEVDFCGFPVRIGDYADELLGQIEDAGYPCETLVRRSENREFITAIYDMEAQMGLFVTNNMIDQVYAWKR
jgi:hypothetical protein